MRNSWPGQCNVRYVSQAGVSGQVAYHVYPTVLSQGLELERSTGPWQPCLFHCHTYACLWRAQVHAAEPGALSHLRRHRQPHSALL